MSMDEEHARLLTICLLVIFGIVAISEIVVRGAL